MLAFVINPFSQDDTTTEAIAAAQRYTGRWLAMAVIMFLSAVLLTLGLPSVLTLLTRRGRRLGVAGAILFSVGTIGLAGYGSVLVVLRAMVLRDVLEVGDVNDINDDPALVAFFGSWLFAFFAGLLLVAVALLRARTVPMWVPLLMLASLLSQFVLDALGDFGTVLQFLALTVAFTGIAISASTAAHVNGDHGVDYYTDTEAQRRRF